MMHETSTKLYIRLESPTYWRGVPSFSWKNASYPPIGYLNFFMLLQMFHDPTATCCSQTSHHRPNDSIKVHYRTSCNRHCALPRPEIRNIPTIVGMPYARHRTRRSNPCRLRACEVVMRRDCSSQLSCGQTTRASRSCIQTEMCYARASGSTGDIGLEGA